MAVGEGFEAVKHPGEGAGLEHIQADGGVGLQVLNVKVIGVRPDSGEQPRGGPEQ